MTKPPYHSQSVCHAALVNLGIVCLVVFCGFGLTACQSADSKADATRSRKPLPSLATAPTFTLSLSVEEAYAAIPHRRTQADLERSTLASVDKDYLKLAFHEIDQAILLRVTALRQFSRGDTDDVRLLAKMEQVIEFLRGIEPPANLVEYHKRLLQTLVDQRAFFQDWQAQGRQFAYAGANLSAHAKVQSSSGAARAAYQILMQNYSGESQSNKDAFFDYHCALDFI
ncbi:MAG: hypothetical protein HY231_20005 [Acidobacteria bacterium]|nr:hypothetical protein [Acidobacteriota bacterium]